MTYKELSNLFTKKEVKIKMALRIFLCKPFIRKAINTWLEMGDEPTLEVRIAPEKANGKSMILSSQALIHDFLMEPLDALLFIDWAMRNDDNAYDALEVLTHSTKPFKVEITEDMWKHINPEVLKEREKIRAREEQKLAKLEKMYETLLNHNIDD